MRGDALVATQRLMAQAVGAMADHIANSTGYQLTPVKVAELPANPQAGMLACVTDGNPAGGSIQWGDTGTGGGTELLLIWYNGTKWTVVGK